jgi:hypothetical protein
MKKKKFDLTSSIVDVSLDKDGREKLSSKKNNTSLTISIDDEKRREFKAWCADKGLKMNEAFLEAFELLKEYSNKNKH